MWSRLRNVAVQVTRRQGWVTAATVSGAAAVCITYAACIRGPLQPVVSSYCWHEHQLSDQLKYTFTLANVDEAEFERLLFHVSEHEKRYGALPLWLQQRVRPIDLDRRKLIRCILHNGQLHLLPLYERYLGKLDWSDVATWKEEMRVMLDQASRTDFDASVSFLLNKVPTLMDPEHVTAFPWSSYWHSSLKLRLLCEWPAILDHLPLEAMLLGYGNREFRKDESDTRTQSIQLLRRLESRIATLSTEERNTLARKVTRQLTYWPDTLGVEVAEILQRCGAPRDSLQTTGLIWKNGSHEQLKRLLLIPGGGVDLHAVQEHTGYNLRFLAEVELAYVRDDRSSYSWIGGSQGIEELEAIVETLHCAGVPQQARDVHKIVEERIQYNERMDAESYYGGGCGVGGGSYQAPKSCPLLR